jgi:hypothetical protein
MSRVLRSLATVVAAAGMVLAGSSSVLAAAEPQSTSLDASFCYVSGTTERCYAIDGTMLYLDTAAGSSYTLHKTVRTTVYQSGEYAGETFSTQMSRGVFQADGTAIIDSVINTRSTVGDEPCAYRLVIRLVDYEAQVFQETQTCS